MGTRQVLHKTRDWALFLNRTGGCVQSHPVGEQCPGDDVAGKRQTRGKTNRPHPLSHATPSKTGRNGWHQVKPISQTLAHATAFHSSKRHSSKAHHQRCGIMMRVNAVPIKWDAGSSKGVNTGMAACSNKRQALERSTGKMGNN